MTQIQPNTIENIDCLEGIKRVASKSVSLVIADPPYFLGMTHNGQRGSFVDLAICRPFYEELMRGIKHTLKEDAVVFWFCDWRSYAFYYPVFDAVFGASNLVVWDKMSGAGNKLTFSHELVICHFPPDFNKGGSPIWRIPAFSSGAASTNGKKIHPTQKTIEIITKMVTEFSEESDLVLDPFMGSGTTALVCKQQNRGVIGFELDIQNFNTIKRRLNRGIQSAIRI